MEIPFACVFIEALASYDNANHASYLLNFFPARYKAYEKRYSLVLEYAEGGTLRNYLRNNGIVHGDLHSNNILIHKVTIKLTDFSCSFEKGKCCDNTEINEKSDIYSLAVTFWELTSCLSPFNYEMIKDHTSLMLDILNVLRENPIPNTNIKFIELYQKCWKYETDDRPNSIADILISPY
ncbi:kinase-like protein [Rhizophagus irregularis]|uniref:Kinase-like protein n=1 Tax=Rhizophagus irregularis TaxID=588596 RepID=A0A2N0PYY3_9GLOM|nr:kinase-like protein [Rhizophagus irregularis]